MSLHKKNTANDTKYPTVGDTPVEVNVHNRSKDDKPSIPVTRDTAFGTRLDHLDTIDIKKDHIVHKGDKQPTELHEPKAEKNYKLRDDEKEYEFKPRTEYSKTKDGSLKAWEEHGRKDQVILEHGVHDHGTHVHEHGAHVHEHGVHDHGIHDRDNKEGIKEKLKGTKDKVKDKMKERKEQKKLHESPEFEKTQYTEHTRVEGALKPEYERTEYTRGEGVVKPEYERTEYTRVEGGLKPDYEKTEYTRIEGKDHPYVTVGQGPVEIHEPREEHKMKDEENIHVKFNINKT